MELTNFDVWKFYLVSKIYSYLFSVQEVKREYHPFYFVYGKMNILFFDI